MGRRSTRRRSAGPLLPFYCFLSPCVSRAQLAADKATLTEANRKVLAQLNSMFSFGQAVQTGLAFKGLSVNATPGL